MRTISGRKVYENERKFIDEIEAEVRVDVEGVLATSKRG